MTITKTYSLSFKSWGTESWLIWPDVAPGPYSAEQILDSVDVFQGQHPESKAYTLFAKDSRAVVYTMYKNERVQ